MTTSTNRSRTLNCPIPDDLVVRAVAQGIDLDHAWMTAATDLNLAGNYEAVFVVVEPNRLVTIGPPAAGDSVVRLAIRRQDITQIRNRHGVGGGFLEVLVEGIFVEVAAYSNRRADVFHKVAGKLKDWLTGSTPSVGPEDDENPRKCPKCGMTLEFKGDLCRRCIKQGAVFSRVLKMMRPHAGRAAMMMALVLISIGLSLIPQQLVRILIDRVLAPSQAGNPAMAYTDAMRWLVSLVAALFGVQAVIALVGMLSGRLSSYVGTQLTYEMRSRVFSHLTRLGVGYYDRYNVGHLMSRVTVDTEQMKMFVHQLTNGFLAQLITVVAVGAVLFSLNWQLALITLLPAPLVMVAAIFFWRRIYPRYYRVYDANSKLSGVLNTILSGIRVVKAFGQEPRERERFGRTSAYVRDSFRGVEYTVSKFNPAIGLIFQLGGILVWFFGGRMVLQQYGVAEGMTLGALMAFLGYLWMFYAPLGVLTQLTSWLTQFLTAMQRTFEILNTPAEIVERPDALAMRAPVKSVRFNNVTFGYSRHDPVIRSIDFEINHGEHIGIVGKSGSGKTTLINLLARFYDVDEGRILLNGTDIRDLKIDDLRRTVGIVLQEPFLFRGTIYDNITYGHSDATFEQALRAAKAANAHGFIVRQPLGYDTYIGERGAGLSGGERQRISIARALLYDPEILVFDEATSSVDTESEQLIQEALSRVTAGRTTVTIAHRLSTLKKSDRILVIDGGRVLEVGTHEELLALDGLYAKLVRIQTQLSRIETESKSG